jgi:hypothetical protein
MATAAEELATGRRMMAVLLDQLGVTEVRVRPLPYVITLVANKSDMDMEEMNEWIQSVQEKLGDVGVHTLRQFVTNVVGLNGMLTARGHGEFPETTLKMMLEEACMFVMGPEGEDEEYKLVVYGDTLAEVEEGYRQVRHGHGEELPGGV